MSVTYYSYLYLGVKVNEHLKIDTVKDSYHKFDPKTGQKTNKVIIEKTKYTLHFGDKQRIEEVEGDAPLKYYEETFHELFSITYNDKISVFQDYNNPEESVVGFKLSVHGGYDAKQHKYFSVDELQKKSKEVKKIFKEKFNLDIEPRIFPLTYISY